VRGKGNRRMEREYEIKKEMVGRIKKKEGISD
jgi:hypothetical protein